MSSGWNFTTSLCDTVPSGEQHAIRSQIHDQSETSKHDLRPTREPGRIEHRLNVVLDESSTVSRLSAAHPERILEWRQRTDPAAVLDENAPDGGGNVNERHPRPAEHQQSAQHNEEDEPEVNDQYEIGERAVDQGKFFYPLAPDRKLGNGGAELHPSDERVESWLGPQRIENRMHAQVGGPAAPLIDGATRPVESLVLVAEGDVHYRLLHG